MRSLGKYGIYPEQILLFILVVIIWWFLFYITINNPSPQLQREIQPVRPDIFEEGLKVMRESAYRNPMQSRKSDMPGGLQ